MLDNNVKKIDCLAIYRTVLFYTNTPRAFRTTLIGHLYEISKAYRVVVLVEDLDSNTLTIIKDKNLFPNIEKIIPVYQHTGPKMNLFTKHKYLCRTAKQVMSEICPDIVVVSSDWHSMFEMYLMRFAKKAGALKVTFQDTFNIDEMSKISTWMCLFDIYSRTPPCFPFILRRFIIQLRRYLGYVLYHWILPITSGQMPFLTRHSYVLFKGCTGLGDSDYHVVLTVRDYLLHLRNGVPEEKLHVLAHPINRDAKLVFDKVIESETPDSIRRYKDKIVTVMLGAEEIGIRRHSYSLITKKERNDIYLNIFRIITDVLPNYRIIIKPHPLIGNLEEKQKLFSDFSEKLEWVNPSEGADTYIEIADIIIELPRATSTTLFSATLQCPQKPIIALDLQDDFLGDCYKNFDCVDYINNTKSFISILESIRDNTYTKNAYKKEYCDYKHYSNTAEILEYFRRKKQRANLISC